MVAIQPPLDSHQTQPVGATWLPSSHWNGSSDCRCWTRCRQSGPEGDSTESWQVAAPACALHTSFGARTWRAWCRCSDKWMGSVAADGLGTGSGCVGAVERTEPKSCSADLLWCL